MYLRQALAAAYTLLALTSPGVTAQENSDVPSIVSVSPCPFGYTILCCQIVETVRFSMFII